MRLGRGLGRWLAAFALLAGPAAAQQCDAGPNAGHRQCAFSGEWSPDLDLHYHLPHDIRPISYDVTIAFFDGTGNETEEVSSLTMHFSVDKSTSTVILRAARLQELEVQELTCNGESVDVVDTEENKVRETFELKLESPLTVGSECNVTINYRFVVNCKRGHEVGFWSVRSDGFPLLSQGQDLFARRMFPCLDHPGLKARFRTRLLTTPALAGRAEALSNGPLLSATPTHHGLLLLTFEETPKMSPYLWAIVVAEKEKIRFLRKESQIIAFGSKAVTTDASLRTMADRVEDSLRVLYGLFPQDIPRPMKTIKAAAIDGFYLAAMENWGMIMGKDMDRNMETTTHESCHSLFGNLMTMADYEFWWMNEGLNEYFTMVVKRTLHPTSAQRQLSAAFGLTQLAPTYKASHTAIALENHVYLRRTDCSFGFVYSAGPALMHMVASVMGDEAFLWGMGELLVARAEASVTSGDFIAHMGKAVRHFKVRHGWVPGALLDTNAWLGQVIRESMGGLIVIARVRNADTIELRHICLPKEMKHYSKAGDCRAGRYYIPIVHRYDGDPTNHVKWITPETKSVILRRAGLELNPECRSFLLLLYPGAEFAGWCSRKTESLIGQIIAGSRRSKTFYKKLYKKQIRKHFNQAFP